MQLKIDNEMVYVIQDAAKKAITDLFQKHKEHFYYCSLITIGEAVCPFILAWSDEALERIVQDMGDIEDIERERYYLKWSYAESPYYAYGYEAYFGNVKKLFEERDHKIADDEVLDEVDLRLNCMERAMYNLDKEGLFGTGEQRLKIVINAEYMPPDYTNTERALRLNPKEALTEWLDTVAEDP